MKKIGICLLAALCAAACSISVSGAGTASSPASQTGTVEIYTTYFGSRDMENWGAYIAGAADATGLAIDLIMVDPTDYELKLNVMIAAYQMPDILYLSEPTHRKIRDDHVLEDLSSSVLAPGARERFAPAGVEDLGDGRYFLVPTHLNVYSLWMNRAYLEEMELGGRSAFSLQEFPGVIAGAGRDSIRYDSNWNDWNMPYEIAHWVTLFGGDLADWSNPANRQAIAYMKRLSDLTTQDLVASFSNTDLLIDGSCVAGMQSNAGPYLWRKGALDTVGMVALTGSSGKPQAMASPSGFAMSNNTRNRAASLRFLGYAAGIQGQVDGMRYMDWFPARTDFWRDFQAATPLEAEYQRYALNTTFVPVPAMLDDDAYYSELGRVAYTYFCGNLTTEEFYGAAQTLADRWKQAH